MVNVSDAIGGSKIADFRSNCGRYSSTWVPSSTTRLVGTLKKSVALTAIFDIATNRLSRQCAIPGATDGISVSRDDRWLSYIENQSEADVWLATLAR